MRSLRRVWPVEVFSLLAPVLTGAAALTASVGLAAVAAWLIARCAERPPVLELTVAFVAVRALGLSRAVFRYLHRLVGHRVALAGVNTLRERLYRRLANGRTETLVAFRRGEVIARLGRDVDALADAVVRGVLPFAVAAVVCVASALIVGVVLPSAGIVLAIAFCLSAVVVPALVANADHLAQQRSVVAQSNLSAIALDLVEEASELRVSGTASSLHAALAAEEAALADAQRSAAAVAGWAAALSMATFGACAVTIAYLAQQAALPGPQLALVVLTPLAAFEATAVLPAALSQLFRADAAAERILAIETARTRHPERSDEVAESKERSPLPSTPPNGSAQDDVYVRGLTVGWPNRPPAITGLDLDLRRGQLIAIVGPSGCGKTTALLTLAGAIPPLAGTLTPTGPRVITLTLEDAHVFDTTIFENLRVARGDLTRDEARDALTHAGLGHFDLDATAVTLSGGERRRLLLARALSANAPFVALDEPTEHLDARTADALMQQLRQTADTGRGVLVVTHRLASLALVDEVVVLEPGRVAARGTHAHLLATNAWYRTAVAATPATPAPSQPLA